MDNPLRNLPSVNQLLENPHLKRMVDRLNHQVVVEGVRDFLGDMRQRVSDKMEGVEIPATTTELAEKIAEWLGKRRQSQLRAVINGTGIILHTGLGRSPLPAQAIDAIREIAGGYCSVEIDMATGQRGQRAEIINQQLRDLTGCEAAAVANNNAAATMLTLSALAGGQEVIVSRGQLVEIGGSYRLPEVMECSGCIMKEIGTTNKTRLSDYENAINENTGAILRVHPSNYQVVGFTETPNIEALCRLGHKHSIPVIDDVGSGALTNFAEFGLVDEPLVRNSIDCGADVVMFSGDKLTGGPQCGIMVGKKKYISRIIAHPLMRAMRIGKLTLAALSATLDIHLHPDRAKSELPIMSMLSTALANLELRAKRMASQIEGCKLVKEALVVEGSSMLGGGSIPGQEIPSWCVSIEPAGITVDQLAAALRSQSPAVLGRIQKDRLLLDMRTIMPNQDVRLATAFEKLTDLSR